MDEQGDGLFSGLDLLHLMDGDEPLIRAQAAFGLNWPSQITAFPSHGGGFLVGETPSGGVLRTEGIRMSILNKWVWGNSPVVPTKGPTKTVFLHIPKAAGSSFNLFLEKLHEPGRSHILGDYFNEKILQDSKATLFSAHMFYEEIAPKLTGDPIYLTFLREPLDRALSHYYFLKLDSVAREFEANQSNYGAERFEMGTALIGKAKRMSLLEFLRSEKELARLTISNLQTKMLGGSNDFSEVGEKEFRRAKENLEKFFFVGLVEKMAQSQDEFSRLCRLPKIQPEKTNTNSERNKLSDEPAEAVKLLTEANRYDLELYRYAQDLFEAQKKKSPREVYPLSPATNFTLDRPFLGQGWHPREKVGSSWICWSGPTAQSWLELSTDLTGAAALVCNFFFAIHEEVIAGLKVTLNETPLDHRILRLGQRLTLRARVPESVMAGSQGRVRIAFHSSALFSPKDLDPQSPDKRKLGFALESVRLEPSSFWS